MKFNNIAKSVIAASALTVASFGANATVISSAILDVTGFGLAINGATSNTPPVSTWTLKNDATFNGVTENQTNVSSLLEVVPGDPTQGKYGDPALVCAGTSGCPIGENTYTQNLLNLGDNLDFSSADSYVFTNPAVSGTDASTRADTSIHSVANGTLQTAGSEIQNSINTTINFSIDGAVGSTIDLFYSYTAQLVTEISNDWLNPTHQTQADADYGLSFTLTRDDMNLGQDFGGIGLTNFGNLATFGASGSSNATNEAGTRQSFGDQKVVSLTNLTSGDYKLVINHRTSASSRHVPEPTSIAILGLGLLGLVGAARRRKS